MANVKRIEKKDVIDAAHRIIARDGTRGLTHGTLADEAGISKGGVASCFGSNQGLLDSLEEDWISALDVGIGGITDHEYLYEERLHRHALSCGASASLRKERIGSLLSLLSRGENERSAVRQWYKTQFGELDAKTDAERNARLGFLAAEGIFLLQALGLMEISTPVSTKIEKDISRATTPSKTLAKR